MARVALNDAVFGPDSKLQPFKPVQIVTRGGTTPVVVYAAETGATTIDDGQGNVSTDDEGRIPGWVDQGSYDRLIGSERYPFEAARGDAVGGGGGGAPAAHASSHATAGSDPVSPASIGASAVGHGHAESDVTGLTTDLAAKIAKSLGDAKGDSVRWSGDDVPARSPAVPDGLVEVADSGAPLGIRGGIPRVRDALGLGSGGFKRVQTTPIADRSGSSNGFTNPAGYAERNADGTVTAWVYGGDGNQPVGGSIGGVSDLVYFKGSGATLDAALKNLTYQGVAISHTQVTGLNANYNAISGSGVVRDSGGTYHQFVVAGHFTTSPAFIGEIVHFTASSPDGPWTLAASAIQKTGTEAGVYDNSAPVFFNGQWVIAFMSMDNGATWAHTFQMATASSLNGPWTRTSPPVKRGGYGLNVDSPSLIVDGDRLLCMLDTVGWFDCWYDVTDLANGWYLGPCLQLPDLASATNPETGDSSGWGAGNVFRLENEVFLIYHAVQGPSPGTGNYPRAFAAKWLPGKVYVPVAGPITPVAGMLTSNAATPTPAIGLTAAPAEAYALDMQLIARDVSTPFTAGSSIAVDSGNTADLNSLLATLQLANVGVSVRGIVPLLPGGRTLTARGASLSGANNGRTTLSIYGYWRLP